MVLLLILFLLLTAYEYRRQIVKGKKQKKDEKNYSESILQKRIKRFKSIKRGYYSLIGLVLFYVLSLISPLWINDKPLMVQYKNGKYDLGEVFIDENENEIWDANEQFEDKYEAFYPAVWELIDWIPGVTPPILLLMKIHIFLVVKMVCGIKIILQLLQQVLMGDIYLELILQEEMCLQEL